MSHNSRMSGVNEVLSRDDHGATTKRAILLSNVLFEPLASLLPLLPFILCKGLGATAFQIVLLTMLRPVVSLFSFYWSSRISGRADLLRKNLVWAGLLARLPFIVSLFTGNTWLIILASSIYMLFYRGGIPAWMEILKRNLDKQSRQKYFAIGSALGYTEGALIAIGVGALLDHDIYLWKWIFAISIFLGLLGTFVQALIPVQGEWDKTPPPIRNKLPMLKQLLKPWKDSWVLMRERRDFARFQLGFMLGGFGLMLVQPVIPFFFSNELNLSYRDLLIAISICKGLGFVVTSRLWGEATDRKCLNRVTGWILLGFGCFPLLLVFSTSSILWVYGAYLLYGVAQAGSHLVWHLSGPIFSGREESLRFSGVNIVMVGVRGIIGPPCGGLLNVLLGPIYVLCIGSIFCFSASGFMYSWARGIFPRKVPASV
ncbi:MAG: hypothetical protein S4CHLAM102_00140 [Chlamydiia bacterium]|nr:hypothetical protein [Chlamydiia bacterium]